MLDWLINTFLKNQFSTLGMGAGAVVVAHGAAAGYTQDQIAGAIVCILSVALQYGENYFRDQKHAKALAAAQAAVPPGYIPKPMPIEVKSAAPKPLTPQATMAPIPDPKES